jgi:methylmalonyl-CoA mutase
LTDEIARAAWAEFQAIEAQGGLIAALAGGHMARRVEVANAARGDPKILGVTAFPPETDASPEVERRPARAVEAPSPRLPGPDGACPPLAPIRLAEAYEVTA